VLVAAALTIVLARARSGQRAVPSPAAWPPGRLVHDTSREPRSQQRARRGAGRPAPRTHPRAVPVPGREPRDRSSRQPEPHV